jgi:hypothetical protein
MKTYACRVLYACPVCVAAAAVNCIITERSELDVTLITRQKGSRRLDLPVEFPLEDGQGLLVIQDRRQLQDRRKPKYGIEDLRVILSKMADD